MAKAWFVEVVECAEGTCKNHATLNLFYKNTFQNNPEYILIIGAKRFKQNYIIILQLASYDMKHGCVKRDILVFKVDQK